MWANATPRRPTGPFPDHVGTSGFQRVAGAASSCEHAFLVGNPDGLDQLREEHGPLLALGRRLVGHIEQLEERLHYDQVQARGIVSSQRRSDRLFLVDAEPVPVGSGGKWGVGATAGPVRTDDDVMRQRRRHIQLAVQRVTGLGVYLHGALLTAERALYEPSFAQIRGALEHHTFDKLLFLSERQRSPGEQTNLIELEKSLARQGTTLAERTQGDLDIVRDRNGKLIMVSREEHISPYFFEARAYLPFRGDVSPEQGEYWREHRSFWRDRLSWRKLSEDLEIVGLATSSEVDALRHHYDFVSAFVHPVSFSASERFTETGTNGSRYSHCGSELLLSYICHLACGELQAFARLVGKYPEARLDGWPEIERDLERADGVVHFVADEAAPADTDPLSHLEELHRRGQTTTPCSYREDG